ncbi:unnamed protein product [Ascophyllum nodosum]
MRMQMPQRSEQPLPRLRLALLLLPTLPMSLAPIFSLRPGKSTIGDTTVGSLRPSICSGGWVPSAKLWCCPHHPKASFLRGPSPRLSGLSMRPEKLPSPSSPSWTSFSVFSRSSWTGRWRTRIWPWERYLTVFMTKTSRPRPRPRPRPCPRPRCRSLLPRGCGSCRGEDATSASWSPTVWWKKALSSFTFPRKEGTSSPVTPPAGLCKSSWRIRCAPKETTVAQSAWRREKCRRQYARPWRPLVARAMRKRRAPSPMKKTRILGSPPPRGSSIFPGTCASLSCASRNVLGEWNGAVTVTVTCYSIALMGE